jgi:hypothetical protein
MKKAFCGCIKIAFEVDIKHIITGESFGHLPKEPTESIICLNMKIRVLKPLIT